MTDLDQTMTMTDASQVLTRDTTLLPALTVLAHPERRFVGLRRTFRGDRTELGRGSGALGPGVLDDKRLSRQHVELRGIGDALEFRDRDSRNGTWVNGERSATGTVRPGDVLRIGRLVLVCHLAPSFYDEPRHTELLGRSWPMARLVAEIGLAAPRASSVLVLGETGTGKELVARAIHRTSGRTGRLVAVNCGAVAAGTLLSTLFGHARGAFTGASEAHGGLVREAEGGTLFLDEIGDAPPELQVALLRLLEASTYRPVGSSSERRANVRVVAATHRDVHAMVADGTFRQDLAERLRRWEIQVPTLRDRPDDLDLLAGALARRHGHPTGELSPELVERFASYRWPGNVRELDAVMERLVALTAHGPIPLNDIAERALRDTTPDEPPAPARAERRGRWTGPPPTADELRALLATHSGHVADTARALGVGRATLYRWMNAAGVSPDESRDTP